MPIDKRETKKEVLVAESTCLETVGTGSKPLSKRPIDNVDVRLPFLGLAGSQMTVCQSPAIPWLPTNDRTS